VVLATALAWGLDGNTAFQRPYIRPWVSRCGASDYLVLVFGVMRGEHTMYMSCRCRSQEPGRGEGPGLWDIG
jgi:hypothetical protein